MNSKAERPPNCPECGDTMVPVIYGMPDPEIVELIQQGKIRSMGCTVTPDGPKWACNTCDPPFPTIPEGLDDS